MRVFYRSTAPKPGTNDLSTSDGPPVPQETLSKLGIKLEKLGIGPDARARAQSIAQSSGHQNPEGFKLVFNELDEDKYQELLKFYQTMVTEKSSSDQSSPGPSSDSKCFQRTLQAPISSPNLVQEWLCRHGR
ncbi:hypothetical protein L218DRAFT_1010762 [Marasmius fiardii PR-910]|nr:hypothetical protein L218DRAFT_1010762 [Marasmius fiardii PR-910]